MKKIIETLRYWLTGGWGGMTVSKMVLIMGIVFGAFFGVVKLLSLSIHFTKIFGASLAATGIVGILIKAIKGCFSGEEKANSIILIIFFSAVIAIGALIFFTK